MLELAGEPNSSAAQAARDVLQLETAMARVSMGAEELRDSARQDNPTAYKAFSKKMDGFSFPEFFRTLNFSPPANFNVGMPAYFEGLNQLVKDTPLPVMKQYLRWRLLSRSASLLSKPFAEESFDFYGRTLSGAKEMQPRWKRCVRLTDRELGELLGEVYVQSAFAPANKARVLEMVDGIHGALETRIKDIEWMGEKTRQAGLTKLGTIRNKIGYPDAWRDYSSLEVSPTDLVGNVQRSNLFESRRQLGKVGKPIDRNEWFMSPPTVNAYYDPQANDINFPAGILQPPFFDVRADDALNYGAIGAVIGHELSHGFDDEGRKFDAEGNLKDWWTARDAKEFEKRAQCFVDQYSSYTAIDDLKINGRLTLGENTADNGGVRLAYAAYKQKVGANLVPERDGLTGEQRFFVGWAQAWCENTRPESVRLQVQTNPHSYEPFRVNGVVSNMPEFAAAFQCKPGAPMVKPEPCKVW
jgi:endothelin-converting enzyme/putative endopeptidase